MDSQAQWDGGVGFAAGCRREGGKGAEKGHVVLSLATNTVPPQQDTTRKAPLQAQIPPELFSGPTVLQILGRSIPPSFKKPLWLQVA